jgi:hypothetical protein
LSHDTRSLSPTLAHGTAFLLLFAVFAAAFWPILVGTRSFMHWDLFYEHVPIWSNVQRCLQRGEAPFWTDGQFGGTPLLYLQEAPVLHPLTVPLLLSGLAPHRAADAYTLVHFLLAGVFAYCLCWDLTRRRIPSLLAGVAWMLGARTLQSAIWPNAVGAAAYLPLLVLGLLRIGRGERRSGIVLAAVSGGLLGLNARPQSVVGALPLIVSTVVAAVWNAGHRKRALYDVGLAAVLALGLSAPSLLPISILHPEMDRSAGLSAKERNVGSVRWRGDLDEVFLPSDGRDRFPEAAAYPGVAAGLMFLAGAVLAARRAPGTVTLLTFAAGGVMGLMFAFGDAGPYRLLSWLPVLRNLHVPARFLISWAFAVAIGAGLGAATLAARSRAGEIIAVAALALLIPDLVAHAWRASPAASEAHYRVTPPVAAWLAARPPDASGFPRRFWTTVVGLPDRLDPRVRPDWAATEEPVSGALGLRYGLEGIEGRGLSLLRIRQLLDARNPMAARLAGVDTVVSELPDLPFARVARRGPPTWNVANALPRAWVVPRALSVSIGAGVRAALSPGFDPGAAVIVEGPVPPAQGMTPIGPSSVRLLQRRGGSLTLEVDSSGGFLVLADAYEAGWGAFVDGEPAQLLLANGAFRAVPISPGRRRVSFRYTPRGLREGLGLLAASALGLVLVMRKVSPIPGIRAMDAA